MKSLARFLLAGCLVIAAECSACRRDQISPVRFKGNFAGKGTVQVTTDVPNVSVSCSFKSNATSTSLSLDGNCRGLVVVSRAISANLKVTVRNTVASMSGPAPGRHS